jgi:DNA-binding NarL/FixJ family response regulator
VGYVDHSHLAGLVVDAVDHPVGVGHPGNLGGHETWEDARSWRHRRSTRTCRQAFARQPPASGAATIVVTIEEASASERVELFGRAFGLSAREYELVGLLATGSDTRSMAREMSLSEHTIQDHLKSIFAKTGAHDRVTVLSRALGTRLETHR